MTESVTTGAAPAATPHAAQSWGRAAYDAYAEGLYTYCLSVLRDHSAASSALRSSFVLADRHIGRLPDLGLLKPWLYALARYECLVRLDGGGPVALPVPAPEPDPADLSAPGVIPVQGRRAARERSELALLAWPESVGLDAEHREALELSVRHGLEPRGLAAVLGWEEDHARRTLLHAGREVDRTRAALEGAGAAVSCPDGPGLAADVASPGVRDRLVDHVDACRRCRPHVRLAAARLVPIVGAAADPHPLPTITPPDELRTQVLGDVGRGRSAHRPAELTRRVAEFDRAGFPVFRSRAGRGRPGRRRMTAVAAAVLVIIAAVPAFALWQAVHRNDDTKVRATTISAARVTTVGPAYGDEATREPTGAGSTRQGQLGSPANRPLPSSVAPPAAPQPGGRSGVQAVQSPAVPGPAAAGPVAPQPVAPPPAVGDRPAPTGGGPEQAPTPPRVEVAHDRDSTVVTLRNTGPVPVDWTAETAAAWLRLSRTSGTLAPGETATLTVTVDSAKAPSGSWTANIRIQPGSSQVTIEGSTDPGGEPSTSPKPSGSGTPGPTASPTASATASARR
ncbi:BACON domain-containing protein [Streptodolium elevatio]